MSNAESSEDSISKKSNHDYPDSQNESGRYDRAQEIDIHSVEKLDYGAYLVELTNDRGQDRTVVCQPTLRTSTSPDMSMSGSREDGQTGKYLLALARENEQARTCLMEAIQHDISERNEELQEHLKEAKRLRQETASLGETLDQLNRLED
jgi:hypothetical protein